MSLVTAATGRPRALHFGMPNESTRTVWVAVASGFAVAVAKVGAAVVTAPPAMAAEASHSLADAANDLLLLVAQRRSARPTNDVPLGTAGRPTSGH